MRDPMSEPATNEDTMRDMRKKLNWLVDMAKTSAPAPAPEPPDIITSTGASAPTAPSPATDPQPKLSLETFLRASSRASRFSKSSETETASVTTHPAPSGLTASTRAQTSEAPTRLSDDAALQENTTLTTPDEDVSTKEIPTVLGPDTASMGADMGPGQPSHSHYYQHGPMVPPVGPNNMMTFLAAVSTRRLAIQLSGAPGAGVGPGPGPGPGPAHVLGGSSNLTAMTGSRGAGSLHGGVNVLLGGAMLSGLILLFFLICYCCQRSARKNDTHFRTQYWLPDPDGPLEVFTLDAQSQRLERAAVFLPAESVDALMQTLSPSPPPAYHTVVGKEAGKGLLSKGPTCPLGPSESLADGSGSPGTSCVVDADLDGLPSYEAALKLEAQRST